MMSNVATGRTGFSLIELVAVLTLMGLIVAALSLNWLTPLRKAQLMESVRKVQSLDHQSRRHAQTRLFKLRMVFDLDQGTLTYVRRSDHRVDTPMVYQLPVGHRVRKIVTPTGAITEGTFEYWISRYGMSPSLAVQISDGQRKKWICIAGGTGQSEIYENEAGFSFPDASPRS